MSVRQVFEMQVSAIPLDAPGSEPPPAHPPPGWREAFQARQKVRVRVRGKTGPALLWANKHGRPFAGISTLFRQILEGGAF